VYDLHYTRIAANLSNAGKRHHRRDGWMVNTRYAISIGTPASSLRNLIRQYGLRNQALTRIENFGRPWVNERNGDVTPTIIFRLFYPFVQNRMGTPFS
jgi:hypothetical protein